MNKVLSLLLITTVLASCNQNQTAGKTNERFYHPCYSVGFGKFLKPSHGKREANAQYAYYQEKKHQEPVRLRTAVNTDRVKQEQYAGKPMHYREQPDSAGGIRMQDAQTMHEQECEIKN